MDSDSLGGRLIRAKNLTISYDRRAVIHHLDFHLAQGKTLAILGPNGSGKTTLLKTLAGILSNFDGSLQINCQASEKGSLPQQTQIDRQLPITIQELVTMGLFAKLGAFRKPDLQDLKRVDQVMEQLQLNNLRDQPIKALSGGQMQRALWARLILQDPELILLDEPFSYLDETALKSVLQILVEWRHQKKTIVIVLHDSELAPKISDQVLSLAPLNPPKSPNPTLCLNDLQFS